MGVTETDAAMSAAALSNPALSSQPSHHLPPPPDAPAAGVVGRAQTLGRGWVVGRPALEQDVALALVEAAPRVVEPLAGLAELLAIGQLDLLVVGAGAQPVLPLALAVLAQRRVQA